MTPYAYGRWIKQALTVPDSTAATVGAMRGLAMSPLVGLAGLAGGALYGGLNPGEYTTSDGKKKQRSWLTGALRGGLGYGGLGLLASPLVGALGGYGYNKLTGGQYTPNTHTLFAPPKNNTPVVLSQGQVAKAERDENGKIIKVTTEPTPQ